MKMSFGRVSVVLLLLVLLITPLGRPPAVVTAQVTSTPPQINKQFSPISILPGDTSRLIITIYNSNSFALTNAAWSDNLIGVQPGIHLADPVNLSNTCGGTVTAVPGATTVSLSSGTVPAQVGSNPGSCSIGVDVTSIVQGNLINTIPAGGLTATGGGFDLTNTDPASATLAVAAIAPPGLSKSFNPNTITVGQTSRTTITIRNNDLQNALTQVSLTDNLPANVVVAGAPNPVLSGCGSGAGAAVVSWSGSVTLTNATIAANSTCSLAVTVTSNVHGAYTNTIPAGTIQTHQGVTNASQATAPLNVQGITLNKAFSPASIEAGGTSTLTITLTNPSSVPYTNVSLRDTLPGSVLQVVPDSASTTCMAPDIAGTYLQYDASTPPRWVELISGYVPAGSGTTPGTCTISFQVTAPASAATALHTNTIPAGALITNEGISNLGAASAGLTVNSVTVQISKSFSPTRFEAGGHSTLTITIYNPTSVNLTGLDLQDVLPEGLVADPLSVSTTCETYDESVSSAGLIILTDARLPAGSTCTITAQVTTDENLAGQSFTNTIPANSVSTDQGVTNQNAGSATVTTYTSGLGIGVEKSFNPAAIAAGGTSRLTLRFNAPPDQAIQNFSFVDTLPGGMVVTGSPQISATGCGTLTLFTASGSSTISGQSGAIAANGSCVISLNVTVAASGLFTNTIHPGDIQNTQGQTIPADVSAALRVTELSMSKAFYPPVVNANGHSTLTITLQNIGPAALTNLSLTDLLTTMGGTAPGTGVYIAATPNASTSCGSAVISAVPDSRTLSISGGSVPAQVAGVPGICTIQVDVQGRGANATRTNTIPVENVTALVSDSGVTISPLGPATAQLRIASLTLGVVKGFDPIKVFGGSASTMSIQINNPNNAELTGIAFTDTMPAHMTIANPPTSPPAPAAARFRARRVPTCSISAAAACPPTGAAP